MGVGGRESARRSESAGGGKRGKEGSRRGREGGRQAVHELEIEKRDGGREYGGACPPHDTNWCHYLRRPSDLGHASHG